MFRKIKKGFTALLAMTMIISLTPEGMVVVNATEGILVQEADAIEVDENVLEESTIEENVIVDNKLNYVYLESKTVTTPSSEIIMVSYGSDNTQISGAQLTVQNYLTKNSVQYACTDVIDNTALFEIGYSAEQRGIYEVTDVTIETTQGVFENIHLQDTGMEHIYFGVDEEFEETSDQNRVLTQESYNEIMTEESDMDLSDVELQIVSLGADSSQITTSDINGISDAIAAGNGGIDLVSEDISTEAKKYVVVLDPGHDATHAGARKNGLAEEVLTLKIAQYCKAELEQYHNVTVHMTRNGAACPLPGSSSVTDNVNRVARAASVGADIYVSIHLNSAANSGVNGAEVFYPNSHYRPNIGSAGANLAKQIERQLVALGLNNRGISIRNSGDGSRYPDGSLADYYAVIKHSKTSGFPGVIVEHAYVSGGADASFLKSENNLRALGIADATGIAKYLGVSKTRREVDRAKVEAFVTRLYQKCLQRNPDEVGFKDWVDRICEFETDGVNAAGGFLFSKEMADRNVSDSEFVEILYNVLLDRDSDAVGKNDWLYKLGNGVSRYGIFIGFANSREYTEICESYGIDRGDAYPVEGRDRNSGLTTYVCRLYTKALGRNYDLGGLNDWCNRICDKACTITEMSTNGFFLSEEFLSKNMSDSDYVKTLYRTFFDREYDPDGYDYWMTKLKSGVSREEILKGFAYSKEFEDLKRSYGLDSE